jgi:hypothetical protein
MSTDAVNTSGALAYVYPALKVYLGAAGGAAPPDSSPSVFSGAWCGRVVQSASGSRLDYAELDINLTAPLANRTQPANFARMVDVRLPSSPEIKIARGDYVRESISVTMSGDTLSSQVQLRPYHFGAPCKGYWCKSGPTSDKVIVQEDIIFNPIIDGIVRPNRSSVVIPDSATNSRSAYYFTHPESLDTSPSQARIGETATLWTLRRAVETLMWMLSWDNTETTRAEFIETPTASDLAALHDSTTTGPQVRDVRIPIGTYLPQALDLLMIPLGYNWYVDYDRAAKPIIKWFRIGSGMGREIKLQAAGAVLNLTDSNCNQFSIENAIGDAFNEVHIMGDLVRAEVTLPLFPYWIQSKDTLDAWTLQKDGDNYAGNETVWRLWIANEGGDWDPAVSSAGRPGGTTSIPYFGTLSSPATYYTNGSVFPGVERVHRRVLEEPLTTSRAAGTTDQRPQRLPHFIEYSTDAGSTWKPAEPHWSIQILPDQIGIMFDGHELPMELYEAGASARLRITGTIASDKRTEYIALAVTGDAVNGRNFRQVLVMPDKFRRMNRQTTGPFASVLVADNTTSEAVDDSAAMEEHAKAIRDQNHFADVTCEFRLPGWHTLYKIGDLLINVAGREISLNAAPAGASVNRYVQIVERRFENGDGGPSTVLIVDRGVAQ